jgi:hypothetical protein
MGQVISGARDQTRFWHKLVSSKPGPFPGEMTHTMVCAGASLGFDPRFDYSHNGIFSGPAAQFVIADEPIDANGVLRTRSPIKNKTTLCPICFGKNLERYQTSLGD